MQTVIDLPCESDSQQFAIKLAHCLRPSLVLAFRGDIGAGKTTLIRAMLRSLGITSAIKSPTFSIVESYQTEHLQLHHFDLYRIHEESELDYIGFRDYFSHQAVCCIEWPEHAPNYLDVMDVEFFLEIKHAGRQMKLRALTQTGCALLECLLPES